MRAKMRIPDNLLDELIENEGEMRTGPVLTIGVLRLALDLRETRDALRKLEEAQQRIAFKQPIAKRARKEGK